MLDISQLSCAYDDVQALTDVNLQVGRDEILCLLGPSGCGKTTLLRIIAGLIAEYRGEVSFKGQDLRAVAANERSFGLMFQDYALFPHMTVADNIAYGLRRQRLNKQAIIDRVAVMLGQVGLSGYGDRDVATLSGGEQQRVALARSLAPNPRFLMLDEPLGSLDALLRDQLALELRQTIKAAGLSAIYVTHDHREAYAIADRIAVMDAGTIAQVAEPYALYHDPNSEVVARFLGFSNIFSFCDNDFTRLIAERIAVAPSTGESFLIHPDGVHLEQQLERACVEVEVKVESVVFRGDHREVRLRLPDGIGLTCKTVSAEVQPGRELRISVVLDAIKRFD